MKFYTADIETDGIIATKVWCMSLTELKDTINPIRSFTVTDTEEMKKYVEDEEVTLIMHNGHSFDLPTLERLLKVKKKCQVIDTLAISWYLYPKNNLHGLEFWGNELGTKKVEIDDWLHGDVVDYIHRCEEDVKIQTALWKQMWKHLNLLYEDDDESMRVAKHLSYKMECIALQEKSKWKLDVEAADSLIKELMIKKEEAIKELEVRMPKVPVKVKKTRPKKPYKQDGSLSVVGEKWKELTNENKVSFDYMGEIEVIKGYKDPNPGSHVQIKDWLKNLGWKPKTFDFKRNKETDEVKMVPQIKDKVSGELCSSVEDLMKKEPSIHYLRELSIINHRITVVKGFLDNVDNNGYVMAQIQGLTNTLRFKHKVCVNIPSIRRPYGKEIRSLLCTRDEEKYELCGSDLKSLEDRCKQHYMWEYDPEYVKELQEDDYDPHIDIAVEANLMSKEEGEFYKWYVEHH